jgi:hypothetical protein
MICEKVLVEDDVPADEEQATGDQQAVEHRAQPCLIGGWGAGQPQQSCDRERHREEIAEIRERRKEVGRLEVEKDLLVGPRHLAETPQGRPDANEPPRLPHTTLAAGRREEAGGRCQERRYRL